MGVLIVLGYIAAGLASVGVIWTQGLRPLWRSLRRAEDIYEVVVKLPAWMASVDASLHELRRTAPPIIETRAERGEKD